MSSKTLRYVIFMTVMSLSSWSFAEVTKTYAENSNLLIEISRNQYNRLVVVGDEITGLHFPKNYLNVQRENDGSYYLDAKDDRPFTLFITTKKGRHFSATVNIGDEYGQTIKLVQKKQKPVRRTVQRHKSNRAARLSEMATLLSAAEGEKEKTGYSSKIESGRSSMVQPNLKVNRVYTLSNNNYSAEKYTLKNTGWKPIRLKNEWFKDNKTKALILRNNVLYPRQNVTVVRVQGVSHA